MDEDEATLQATLAAIGPIDERAAAAARSREDRLTKPTGSLGRLEELAIQVAAISGQALPTIDERIIFTCAGDHGVAVEGVSAYPAAVTPQMVYNFVRGGAGINVLARRAGARVVVADFGVNHAFPTDLPIVHTRVGRGTANMTEGPAMSRADATRAVVAGITLLDAELGRHGLTLVATGDMGIGNTTAASAMLAAFTRAPVREVTGRGTGIDDATWLHKVQVIERALARNTPEPTDPLDVLAKVGGYEIGGIAGVILAAAARHCPVVLDGLVSGAAALFAARLCPAVRPYLIAAHRSVEPGHRVLLADLGLDPLLDLNLRLGEGTGAALAMHLVDDALAILREMATFAEAGVSQRDDPD
jgi:nicotinate-nucleotide--dimethylbenzimidazole phosphoribosyltransferase